ncbi:MAG TPA: hypothetical protein VF770_00200, partial [Solirubrobacterales bacterium]
LALGLSACGGGSGMSSSSETARRPAPQPTVTLSAPGHRPVAGAPWPIAIQARGPRGEPLRAEVRYQYLFAGAVVAHRSHYRFRGTFHDTIRWPARSLGIPLTFRAVVTTPLGTRKLDYAVRVKR